MSSQGGKVGVKNCQFYLVKKTTKRGEGVKNRQFSDDLVIVVLGMYNFDLN